MIQAAVVPPLSLSLSLSLSYLDTQLEEEVKMVQFGRHAKVLRNTFTTAFGEKLVFPWGKISC